jgi:outer membrane protein TolC
MQDFHPGTSQVNGIEIMKSIFAVGALLLSFSSFAVGLDDYLNQVRGQNNRLAQTQSFMTAADLQRAQGKILTSINAFSLMQAELDRKQPQFAAFEGVSKERRNFQLGLEQNSSTGLVHRLYSDYSYLNQKDASFIPNPRIANTAIVYEFTLPLLRNFNGKSIRLQQDIISQRASGEMHKETFEQRKIINEAKSAYWRLKTAQEIVKTQEEIINQGQKFLDWTRKRVRDRLSEESDLRQAEAIVDLRKFDLQKERRELLKAQQAFNIVRELDPNTEVAELEDFPADDLIPELPTEENALKRPDLMSLEAQLNAETMEAQRAAEMSRMELNLIGTAATNGLAYSGEPDYGKTFSGKYPTYMAGIRLSVPLDRSSMNDIQKSANIRKRGLTSALHRNRYEAISGLSQLRLDYEQLGQELKIVKTLVKAQEDKLRTERERHRYGRSSTFQLLTFEQDYQQARQDLIRTKGLLWQLSGQTSLYAEGI